MFKDNHKFTCLQLAIRISKSKAERQGKKTVEILLTKGRWGDQSWRARHEGTRKSGNQHKETGEYTVAKYSMKVCEPFGITWISV